MMAAVSAWRCAALLFALLVSAAVRAAERPPRCALSLASGPKWTVYAALPSGAPGGPPLGRAQRVCLEAGTPPSCRPGAIRYGLPPGSGWTADAASLDGAVWIWGPRISSGDLADRKRFVFARTFELPRPAAGTLLVAADDFAELRVNGTRIGSVGSVDNVSVAGAAQSSLARFDLTQYLVLGKNTISVTAENGPASFAGCAGACTYRQNPAGVVFGGSLDMCPAASAPDPAARTEKTTKPSAPGAIECTSAASGFTLARSAGRTAWSYGWSETLGSAFTSYESFHSRLAGFSDGEDLTYYTPNNATFPVAFLNPTSAVRFPAGTFSLQPGQFALHPGPDGEYSITRWRAYEAGPRTVEVTFFGLSGHANSPKTTTDVHVRRNGVSLASGYLNLKGSGNSFHFASTVNVGAADTIEFAVGYGNGAHVYDSTAVDAVVCGPVGGPRAKSFHDFSFARRSYDSSFSPRSYLSGEVFTACGPVTLLATNSESMQGASFRNVPSAGDAEIRLSFTRPPSEVHVAVSWVRADEYLKGFNVAPIALSETLVLNGDRVTTTRPFPADDGAGTLSWLDFHKTDLRFVIGGPPGTALAIDSFSVVCDQAKKQPR
jgi:hypothetical protein